MFACISWDCPAGDDDAIQRRIFAALPDRSRACYYLPKGVLFALDSMAAFLETRGRLAEIRATFPKFYFALTVHDDLTTFAGQARYRLTPEVRRSMGLE